MVTIKDIALKCGLSIASVSKALSGKATEIGRASCRERVYHPV